MATAILLVATITAPAQHLEGQAVTWTDFSYVNHVATSISEVFFATTGGITVYDKMAFEWKEPLTGAGGIEGEEIRRVWVDQFGERLFIQTDFGRYEYEDMFERWYPIQEIPPLNNDARHVSTPQDLLPAENIAFIDGDILTDAESRRYTITDIVEDNQGWLWLGTWGLGAARAGTSARVVNRLPYGLLQADASTLHLSDSILWISGDDTYSYRTGVSVFNLNQNSFDYIETGVDPGFPSADVNDIETDDSTVYLATDDGLYIIDRDTRQMRRRLTDRQGLADFVVRSVLKYGDSLYVGTASGLNIVDFATDSVRHIYPSQFNNQWIYDLELLEGEIWIGSSVGAYRFNVAEDRMRRFNDPHGVLFSRVVDIEAYDRTIWFASDAGVVSLDLETGKTDPYRDIVRRTDSRALAVNDRITAVASDIGVTIIFRNDGKRISRDFTTSDGLASNSVFSLELDGEYLWIGTDRGVTRFWWANPQRVD